MTTLLGSLAARRHRRLKWPALDPLEGLLLALCCLCILGFTVSVLCDVVTRELRAPWLWLQQVTTAFFVYGIFLGMALATRRNEHMYLTEIVVAMRGRWRAAAEVFARLVVLVVAVCMVGFGYQNFRHDLGSFRMPSLIPLGYYTAAIPISGLLIALFCIEQMANGLRRGFEQPDDVPVTVGHE